MLERKKILKIYNTILSSKENLINSFKIKIEYIKN